MRSSGLLGMTLAAIMATARDPIALIAPETPPDIDFDLFRDDLAWPSRRTFPAKKAHNPNATKQKAQKMARRRNRP